MPLKKVYREQEDRKLITYDFFDITSGSGIKTFYPTVASGALLLSTGTNYGWSGHTSAPETSTNGNLRGLNENINKTFETTFAETLTIDGDVVVNLNTVIRRISGGPAATSSSYAVTFSHYDGTTDTVLGTGTHLTSVVALSDDSATNQEAIYVFPVTRQIFKKGDTMRLKLEATGMGSAADTWILTDSKNREITIGTFTSSFSACSLKVPFKINT